MSGLRVRRSSGPDEAAASMIIWSEHHGALGDFVPAQAQRWEKGDRAITDYDDLPSDIRERAQRISLAYDEVHGIPTDALSRSIVQQALDWMEKAPEFLTECRCGDPTSCEKCAFLRDRKRILREARRGED